MKKTKYLFAILFMLVAFLAIGATSVNAETVKTVSNLEELKSFMNDNNVDVIKLNADITASDTLWWYINGGNKTLDLNGFSINSSQEIMFKIFYYGDYTAKVINSSNSASGKINHTYTADYGKTFYLDNAISGKNKTLYIDGVELNESGRARTILCFDNNSTDNLIVKNVNSKSFDFSSGFDNYEFSNTVVRPIGTSRVSLVIGNSTITVKDILGDNQEIYYQAFDRVGGNMISSGVADESLLVTNLWTNNTSDGQDNAITVRYKNGFTVSNVELNETYGYTETTVTAKEIPIKNRGTSDLQIKNVSVDSSNFTIVNGTQTTLSAGATDTTWKIKAKEGLNKGVYTATITVTDMSDNIYTSTVTLTVNPKELTGLGIGGVNSTITYGDSYTPTLTGTTELGSGDYTIKYAKKVGESYQDSGTTKPTNVGEYKVTISVINENYTSSDISVDFKIVAKTITPTIENIADVIYTGEDLTPNVVVKDGSTTLAKDTDYTVEYADNKNVGTAKVTIKPVSGSNYIFANEGVEKAFNIVAKSLTDSNVTLDQTSFRHNGSEIKPEPVVKDGENTLTKGVDYELSYSNNTNMGNNTATVKVTGKGNYKGEVNKNFSIIDKEPQVINFAEASVTKTYGDSKFIITADHTEGNGTVEYTSSNTDVATVNETTGLVTIKKVGNTTIKATASETTDYAKAEATYTLKIEEKDITYTATVNNKKYNNNKTATVSSVEFTGLVGSETLTKDTDYTVTAEFVSANVGNDIDVNVKVILKDTDKANNYNLTNTNYVAKANITGKEILEAWVTVDTTTTYTYNGSSFEPAVTVKDPTGETTLTLTKGTHYTVVYSDNLDAGTGKIKVTGMGNYSGKIEKEFTINKKSITPTIENIADVTYNGSEHTPDLVVKDGSTTLVKGTDYTVEYTNNLRAGNAHAQISEVASSNYTFTPVGKDFTINKYEIKASDVTLEYASTVFDNTAKRPTVTVKMGNEVIPPIDYNVDYSNNTNVGTATVKVTVKTDSDDFTGMVIKNFEIVNKTLLNISGINNQQVVYTGKPVVLAGNLTVSNGINPSDLTVKWYEGTTEISKPTNVGVYKVVYSYENSDYIGSLTVDFEITKKESSAPILNTYKAVAGDKLSSITLPTGFKWVDENETIVAGNKEYSATYTTNNDTTNYTTKNINVKVYGKSKVNLTTSVNNGKGGSISASKTDILEGTTETIKFTPAEGFEINKVEVNGVDKTNSVRNNKLDVIMGNNDVSVVVTYKAIQYTITVRNVENAFVDPDGIIKVDYNSDKTFAIIADLGYKLVSVKVNGVERISDMVYNELTLKNIKADAEIVVVVERNTYEVIEGAKQKYIIGKSNEAKFKINAEYSGFERGGSVYVEDELVDSSNYTSEEGSTIISLKKEFVDKLSIGEHSLKVLFTNGEATTTFTVEKDIEQEKNIELKKDIEPEKDNSFNPKTGDNIILYVAIASISIFGILATVVLKRKKK